MPTTERILVIKHGALGDIIQGLDSFCSLRRGHPDAHIALLTGPAFAGLARLMPWFDEVIIDPRASFAKLAATLRIRSVLRNGWDMIIDQQCSRRTAHYHRWFTPSTTRWFGIAIGASDPYPDFTGINNHQRMLIAAKQAGGIDVTLADNPMSWLDGTAQLDALGVPVNPVILVPGCSPAKPAKRWSVDQFAALAQMAHDAGNDVVVVGTAAEQDTVDALMRQAPFCLNLLGKTKLPDLAALFRRAHLVVGNDTGPVFLAARAGALTVMVMGPETNPDMSAPTGTACGYVRATPIDAVTPQQVMDKAATLVG